jgi:hypothetical protein
MPGSSRIGLVGLTRLAAMDCHDFCRSVKQSVKNLFMKLIVPVAFTLVFSFVQAFKRHLGHGVVCYNSFDRTVHRPISRQKGRTRTGNHNLRNIGVALFEIV